MQMSRKTKKNLTSSFDGFYRFTFHENIPLGFRNAAHYKYTSFLMKQTGTGSTIFKDKNNLHIKKTNFPKTQ